MNIIDGKNISKTILEECKKEIIDKNLHISLHSILVGNDDGAKMYLESQRKKCNEVGINFFSHEYPENVSESELISLIKELNNNEKVNGIFLQMPLPNHINKDLVINAIHPKKDIDGFSIKSCGALFSDISGLRPCTANGIVELIKRSNIKIDGKEVVIVGRSNIVGKPLAILLLKENATVTICHSHTKNLESVCKRADILIVAIKKPKFINENFIKDGAVVIDVGTHKIDGITCGDVDFDRVKDKVSFITPVPGGVGPMTIAMLIKNLLMTCK